MKWYSMAFSRFAEFEGRSTRQEYWMFALFNFLFVIVALVIDIALDLQIGRSSIGYVSLLYSIIALIPGLAVAARRLHDTGKSAWWLLISVVPFGVIALLIFLLTESSPGSNKYGSNLMGVDQDQDEFSELGSDVLDSFGQPQVASSKRDSFIISALAIVLCVQLLNYLVYQVFNLYDSEYQLLLSGIMGLVWSVWPFLVAAAVVKKNQRTVAFVLAGLIALRQVYFIFEQFIDLF